MHRQADRAGKSPLSSEAFKFDPSFAATSADMTSIVFIFSLNQGK